MGQARMAYCCEGCQENVSVDVVKRTVQHFECLWVLKLRSQSLRWPLHLCKDGCGQGQKQM